MQGATMEPHEMVRLWHAAAAISVIVQFEMVPAVERFVWRLFGVRS